MKTKSVRTFMICTGLSVMMAGLSPVYAESRTARDTADNESAFTSSDEELRLGQTVSAEEAQAEQEKSGKPDSDMISGSGKSEENGNEEKADGPETDSEWDGPVLDPFVGTVMGPSGKETYYNMDMSGVIDIMRSMGNTDEYHISENGCKMLGDYIMCAANLDVHPRGSYVMSSLGMCIVCDTGGFAAYDPYQLDIAVAW